MTYGHRVLAILLTFFAVVVAATSLAVPTFTWSR